MVDRGGSDWDMVPEVISDKGTADGLTESRVKVNVSEGTGAGVVGSRAPEAGEVTGVPAGLEAVGAEAAGADGEGDEAAGATAAAGACLAWCWKLSAPWA